MSFYSMISLPDPGNPASQNKHRRAANRQFGNKTALRSGIWAKSALPPPRRRPPFLELLGSLSSAQRSAAQLGSRQAQASIASQPALSSSLPPGLRRVSLPRGPLRVGVAWRGPVAEAQSWGSVRMRLSPAPLRLSRSPALLALALPLAAALAFSDETLDKVPKSEGYCSRILRAQGTRREGYTEFSLRVEGDPDFYKPGTSYRGKWRGEAQGARTPDPVGRRPRSAGGGRTVRGRTVPAQHLRGLSVPAALSPLSHEPAPGPSRGPQPGETAPISDARFRGVSGSGATRHIGLAGREPAGYGRAGEIRLSADPSLERKGPWLLPLGSQARR